MRHLFVPYCEKENQAAEREISSFLGVKHTVLMPMGRMAMYHGCSILLNRGDEIIMSPLTVPECVSVTVLCGAKPVFVDVHKKTWCVDIQLIKKSINSKTKAILATHLYGFTEDLALLREIAKENGLILIEDAAQALGARTPSGMAGSIERFGILSFSYPKNVCTFYGGALVTNDSELAAKVSSKMRNLKTMPRSWYLKRAFSSFAKDFATTNFIYNVLVRHAIRFAYKFNLKFLKKFVEVELQSELFGSLPEKYNTKPTNLIGRIVRSKLGDVIPEINHRLKISTIYFNGLKDVAEINIPDIPISPSNTFLYYPISCGERDSLMNFLISNGQDVAKQHIPNCASLPSFEEFWVNCPNAQSLAETTITLPTYPKYPEAQAHETVLLIRKYFGYEN